MIHDDHLCMCLVRYMFYNHENNVHVCGLYYITTKRSNNVCVLLNSWQQIPVGIVEMHHVLYVFFIKLPVVIYDFAWICACWMLLIFLFETLLVFLIVYPPLVNIRVMVIVWRLRGNIIRTAMCWIVWHNVHSQQHTYMSSSYRSNRLGLSHWDPYTVRRGSCLELYYCNMGEWFRWDSSLIFDDQLLLLLLKQFIKAR